MSRQTYYDYISGFEKLMIIEDVEAWNPSIRSKTSIRSSKKRNFVDPSIAAAALGVAPEYFSKDYKTLGFLFECLCIRDLKIYSSAKGGRISYYHDRMGLEADAVLHLDDGRYALIECKLGSRDIEEGAKHLLTLKSLVQKYNETSEQIKLREPDLLIVITGGEIAYTRNDGVKIIPLACLRD
jgi:predicted AAA+ superfamily ATPase